MINCLCIREYVGIYVTNLIKHAILVQGCIRKFHKVVRILLITAAFQQKRTDGIHFVKEKIQYCATNK